MGQARLCVACSGLASLLRPEGGVSTWSLLWPWVTVLRKRFQASLRFPSSPFGRGRGRGARGEAACALLLL